MKWLLLMFFFCLSNALFAQQEPRQPAYLRYPVIPGLQLFLSDSSKYTNENLPAKKPVLIVLFSPDCEHCQHEAEQIVARKEDLKNIHIIMVTTYPIYRMNAFAGQYGLKEMSNVVMAKDPFYLLLSFYELHLFPYLALYDKKGGLVRTFQGSVNLDEVLKAFETAR